jgi:hypothetical protein
MIETLFAGINGYTVVPGKKNFYPTNQDSFHEIKLGQSDNVELIYENGHADPTFTAVNVQDADPAAIISAAEYGTWAYNILVPKQFLTDFIASLNGYDSYSVKSGKESLIIQSSLEPLYELYKSQGNSDRLVDFVPWLVSQINAYVAKNFLSIYIDSYTLPSVRKIQYVNQANSVAADTNQGTEFTLSRTIYKRRKNMSFTEHSEKFYRVAIGVTTNPTTFEANRYRTNLTINDFDVQSLRVENFYVIHPKVNNSYFKPLNPLNSITNRSLGVQLNAGTNLITRTAHGFENDQEIWFTAVTGTTNVIKEKKYYVINSSANSFKASATISGTAITGLNNSYATLNYETSTPITISNYPEFEVMFGVSKVFNKPTLTAYTKKEDVNLIDRSLTLKESLYGYSNINSASYLTSGNTYISLFPCLSDSGYAITGDTISFFTSLLKKRSVESGIFDKNEATSPIESGFLQIGYVKAMYDLQNKGQVLELRSGDPYFYKVNPQTNATGQFKATNESYFFSNQNLSNAKKSGIYLKVKNDISKYIYSNVSEFKNNLISALETDATRNIYKHEFLRTHGSNGTTNLFYINSGSDVRLNTNLYLYAKVSPFNFDTNSCEISFLSFKYESLWNQSGIDRANLGMTQNTRYVQSGEFFKAQ